MGAVFCPKCGHRRMSSPRWQQCAECKRMSQFVTRPKCARPACPSLVNRTTNIYCSKRCRLLHQPIPKEAHLRGVRAALEAQHESYVRRVAKRIQQEMETALAALPAHLTAEERAAIRTAFLSAGAKIYKRGRDTERGASFHRYVTRRLRRSA